MAISAFPMAASQSGNPGSMGDIRRSNLSLVLSTIAQAAADVCPSRAQVASATGLTKASVSSLVLDLLDAGLICEIEGLHSPGRGRPGVGLQLNPRRAVMGMEINIDYIAAGAVNLSGALLFHEIQERDNRSGDHRSVMGALADLAASVSRAAAKSGTVILGGGLAVPGILDTTKRGVVTAPNLGWERLELDLELLVPAAPLGITLSNEANAAALAESGYGQGIDGDFLFVSGEVGVGGGLVIGRELFTGPDGSAGEVGHVVVDPYGTACSCGGRGCLETVAGQDAIYVAAGLNEHPGARTRSETMSVLLRALHSGDRKALAAVERAGFSLGVALASTARVVPIGSVVLGGHFAVLEPWLHAPLLESLQRYAPGRFAAGQVSPSNTGTSGALLGAAWGPIQALLEAPHMLQV